MSGGPRIRAVFTDTDHGDLSPRVRSDRLRSRRGAIHRAPWAWLDQVHGSRVVVARRPGEVAGERADAIVTTVPNLPIAVHTADCAPVLLRADGAVGVVHAGWRGLLDGVIEATIEQMADLGHPPHDAVLGPCIRVSCYEFGRTDLDPLVERFGDEVVGRTSDDEPALDVTAAVRKVSRYAGLELHDRGVCTACSPRHFSHRARREHGRQALVAWIDPTNPGRIGGDG